MKLKFLRQVNHKKLYLTCVQCGIESGFVLGSWLAGFML
jgi:hypothetical protein